MSLGLGVGPTVGPTEGGEVGAGEGVDGGRLEVCTGVAEDVGTVGPEHAANTTTKAAAAHGDLRVTLGGMW